MLIVVIFVPRQGDDGQITPSSVESAQFDLIVICITATNYGLPTVSQLCIAEGFTALASKADASASAMLCVPPLRTAPWEVLVALWRLGRLSETDVWPAALSGESVPVWLQRVLHAWYVRGSARALRPARAFWHIHLAANPIRAQIRYKFRGEVKNFPNP